MGNNHSQVGDAERKTQNKVIRLFQDKLGYEYLGNWEVKDAGKLVRHPSRKGF